MNRLNCSGLSGWGFGLRGMRGMRQLNMPKTIRQLIPD
jgi:hypothetical protein